MNALDATRRVLERFPDRDRYIIERRADNLTYREIGIEVGLTQERIRQIICKIQRKANDERRRRGLDAFRSEATPTEGGIKCQA